MLSGTEITQLLLTGFGLLFLFFISGAGMLRIAKPATGIPSGWPFVYLSLLSGMLVCVSLYASVVAKGKTILLPIPLLLYLCLRSLPPAEERSVISQTWWRAAFSPFFFSACVYLLFFLFYMQAYLPSGNIVRYVAGDIAFYARLAESLNVLGVENMRVDYIFQGRYGNEPYHYGDIWAIALAYRLGNTLPVLAAMLVVYPLFMTITVMGMASIVARFCRNTITNQRWLIYTSVIVGLIGGLTFLFPTFLFNSAIDVYSQSIANYPKVFWLACVMPLIFYLILSKRELLIVYPVAIICLGYINVAPALLLASAVWIFFCSLRKGSLVRDILWCSRIALPLLLFLFILYKGGTTESSNGLFHTQQQFSFKLIRTAINIFIGGCLQLSIYAPYAVLLLLSYRFNRDAWKATSFGSLLMYSGCLIIAALGSWALLYLTTAEAVQFFHNVLIVLGSMVSFIICVWIWMHHNQWWRFAVVILLTLSIAPNIRYVFHVTTIDKGEWAALQTFIGREPGRVFAHYRPETDYTKSYFASNTVVFQPYPVLNYLVSPYNNYSLNVAFASFDTTDENYRFVKSQMEWAPMSFFIEKNQLKGLSNFQAMEMFLRDYKIHFLCMPNRLSLPKEFAHLVADSLVTPQEGWKVYKCRY